MTPIDPKRIEVLDAAVVPFLRKITPGQKVQQAFESNEFVRQVIACGIRNVHRTWSEDQVQAEIARRMLHGSS